MKNYKKLLIVFSLLIAFIIGFSTKTNADAGYHSSYSGGSSHSSSSNYSRTYTPSDSSSSNSSASDSSQSKSYGNFFRAQPSTGNNENSSGSGITDQYEQKEYKPITVVQFSMQAIVVMVILTLIVTGLFISIIIVACRKK